jgi:CDGSH-type Zn-finger protein
VTVRICALARGPLVVERGPEDVLELVGVDGRALDVAHLRKVRLCRCGASEHAPICDGAHHRVAFEAKPDVAAEE